MIVSALRRLPTRAGALLTRAYASLGGASASKTEEQRLAAVGAATARILHQVKNPLQTILLNADLLQNEALAADGGARREVCDAIVGEAQRAAAMLDELSVYAAGARRALQRRPVELHLLVGEMARAEQRKGRVEVAAAPVEPCTVHADPDYLRQALENLLANAREAMDGQPDARLTLALRCRGGFAVVDVADTGPGIPPERRDGVFLPFVSGKGKGMGLGLTICREIVEGHGGRVEVRSAPEGGACLRVYLPAARRTAHPPRPQEV